MDFSTTKIILIVVTIIVVLLLIGCFWDIKCFSGSSTNCFSRNKKCKSSTSYCKKCGSIPCCCVDAEICGVTRTLAYASGTVSGEDYDEYFITVEGSGLTPTSVPDIDVITLDSNSANAVASFSPNSYSFNNVANGTRIAYASSGYAMTIVYRTGDVGATGTGPATSGNLNSVITYSLNETTHKLTLTVTMAVAP